MNLIVLLMIPLIPTLIMTVYFFVSENREKRKKQEGQIAASA